MRLAAYTPRSADSYSVPLLRPAYALVCLALIAGVETALAAQLDESKLPAPATTSVDFLRDIKPTLERSCFKCHAGEKPKSDFRLTSREAALKGGTQGIAIIPGQSDQSPLIHYVARLVPEMEMPPEDRGTPLTSQEVGLLRAWIDQGLVWEPQTNAPIASFEVSPIVGGTMVNGDQGKFRELSWRRGGWFGGIETFEFREQPDLGSRLTVEGHILPDDYLLALALEKYSLGFTRFGWSQFRKYYDDSGGYFPAFSPSVFSLDRDLYLDQGRAWFDLGLTLPQLPRVVLGYECQYRDGSKSTLQWGPVSNGVEMRNIYPAARDIAERVHILKLDLHYEIAGVVLSDNFRGEWHDLESQRLNDASYLIGSGMALTRADEAQTSFQGANTFHVEKQFYDWLFASGGYLYSKLSSDASMNVATINPAMLDPAVAAPGWHAEAVELERESHVFSLSSLLGPWAGFSLTAGVQSEWSRQQGFGGASVDVAVPFAPFIFAIDPEQFRSDLDRSVFSQNFGLRYAGIPHTAVFAEARFQQETLGQYQEEIGGLTPFLLQTDTSSTLTDFRAGFNVSPWRRVSFSGQYRRHEKDTDYDNSDQALGGQAFPGYPGFLLGRKLLANEVEAKLSFRPAAWLKSSISYSWIDNDYRVATEAVADPLSNQPGGISPGGSLLAGNYQAQAVTFSSTFTLSPRLFISGTLMFQDARTQTSASNDPSIADYGGPIYSVLCDGRYVLSERTELLAGYSFSSADFSQDNFVSGLPLGIQYQQHALRLGMNRRLSHAKSLGLEYRFYLYDEPSAGGATDFVANGVFATFRAKLP